MCISWNDHFLQVLTSASLFKVRESCFVIQKFDVTDSGNYPGWTSFSDYKMTTKFISQPSSVFKMNCVLPTSCCYELDDTLVHCHGCHFPDSMKFPDFSRPRLGSTVSPRPKFSKLGSSTWLKWISDSKIPWLFPDFWNFVTNSLTPGGGNFHMRSTWGCATS